MQTDTHGFAAALRAALREDPDVVLIGEMRDLETVEAALRVAETGHLTLATLHTSSAVQTITRIIDVFPPHQQAQVRTQLSLVLGRRRLPDAGASRRGPGRVCAAEVMMPTLAIRNLIREDKLHQVYSAMQAGQERLGMQTMSQALARLHARRRITLEQALARSPHPDELRQLLGRDDARLPAAGRAPGGALMRERPGEPDVARTVRVSRSDARSGGRCTAVGEPPPRTGHRTRVAPGCSASVLANGRRARPRPSPSSPGSSLR